MRLHDFITNEYIVNFKRVDNDYDWFTISDAQFSADGRILVANGEETIGIWRTDNGELLHTIKGKSYRSSVVALSPDGTHLAMQSDDESIQIASTDSGLPMNTLHGHEDVITSMQFSSNNGLLASIDASRVLYIWRTDSGEQLNFTDFVDMWAESGAFSPDGSTLAVGTATAGVYLFAMPDAQLIGHLDTSNEAVRELEFLENGKKLVVRVHHIVNT